MRLLGTAAKVAVASSVHGRVQRRQRQRWAAQDAVAAAPPPPPASAAAAVPPDAPAPAAAPVDDMQQKVDLLRQLGELRDAGVIDDAEFEVKKAKVLG